jgi:N6-adenosine-specific RNA methylase IME4
MESPLTVYGRLLEAFHLSGYAFDRAFSELEYMLQNGRWMAAGFDDVNKFVGSIDLSKFRHSVDQRQKFARLLEEAEASQRATAKMLGVSHTTIQNDFNSGKNLPPPEWWQADIDPAKLARRQAVSDLRDTRREARLDEINANNRPLDTGIRYPIVYADPPWRYENPPIGASGRSIENHYPTMTLDEICALPVSEVGAEDALLYLWATAPKLAECMKVIASWGFDYRTNLVWDKEIIGMGYHARNQHELLLVAKRGEIPPPPAGTQPSSIYRERRGEHSAKPVFFHEMIEAAYPQLRKLELFQRQPRPGWDGWGNQVEAPDAAA